MATYLVTGGGGFIGSSIAEALLAKGERVRILDDFSTGRRSNLEGLKGNIELFEGSRAKLFELFDHGVFTKAFTELGGVQKYKIINDSIINFIYANGDTIINAYRIDHSSLTLTGGCIEACGSKFIKSMQ